MKLDDFEGHQFKKIGGSWVFDLTTFIGYRVILDNNSVIDYEKSYMAIRDNKSGTISFDKFRSVPLGILRKTTEIIDNYRKEAFLDGKRSLN